MQSKRKVINKLALVLISIVVLELVLIGDQVQSVKAIKKKLLLKKLKKVLPLLALVKPKKKIILLPIPIPMFNKHSGQHHYQTYGGGGGGMVSGGRPMIMDGSNQMPVFVGHEGPGGVGPMQVMPGYETMLVAQPPPPPPPPQSFSMMMPSMTMTIENTAPGGGPGGMSAIEMSTTLASGGPPLANSSQSGALIQQQIQHFDQFDDPFDQQQQQPGGEYYYSSPWSSGDGSRRPPVSPAKLIRGHEQRLKSRQRPRPHQHQFRPVQVPDEQQLHGRQQHSVTLVTPVVVPRGGRLLQQQQQPHGATNPRPLVPVLVIKNQWRPTTGRLLVGGKSGPEASGRQAIAEPAAKSSPPQTEFEELIPVGPPRLMPVYQTPNGQLHMSPPTGERQRNPEGDSTASAGDSFDHEQEQPSQPASGSPQHHPANATSSSGADGSAEVQTVPPRPSESSFGGHHQHQSVDPTAPHSSNQLNEVHDSPGGRLTGPELVKGRQQQLQQHQQPSKRKPIAAAGGY